MAQAQDPRGRDAATPAAMPARGWKEALKRAWKESGDDNLNLIAYYLLPPLVVPLSPNQFKLMHRNNKKLQPQLLQQLLKMIYFPLISMLRLRLLSSSKRRKRMLKMTYSLSFLPPQRLQLPQPPLLVNLPHHKTVLDSGNNHHLKFLLNPHSHP